MKRSSFFSQWHNSLFDAVSPAPLVVFRIAFGLCFVIQAFYYYQQEALWEFFILPKLFFHFPLFSVLSLKVLSATGFSILIVTMGIAAYFVMIGFLFRLSTFILLCSLSYIFLLEKTYSPDPNYLYLLLCFLLLFTRAGDMLSVDVLMGRRKPAYEAVYWPLWMLKAQVVLVYVFSGLGKLFHPDWLSGAVMGRRFHYLAPLGGGWQLLDNLPTALFFSYGGLMYDFSAGFLLWHKRTRFLGIIFTIFFHLFNKVSLGLQIFPFVMLSTILLFIEPSTAQGWILKIKKFWSSRMSGVQEEKGVQNENFFRRTAIIFIFFYFMVQILLPLKHWLYPGDVNWTHEGIRFSWSLMNNNYVSRIHVKYPTPTDPSCVDYQPLNARQVWWMSASADMILQYARYIKTQLLKCGISKPEVYIDSRVSLNGREYMPFINRTVNLASAKLSFWEHADWIMPHPDLQFQTIYPQDDDEGWYKEEGYTILELNQKFFVSKWLD